MVNLFAKAAGNIVRQKANISAAWAVFVSDTVSGFVTTAHHALMILGLSAIGILGVMFVRPDIADHLKALSPFTSAIAKVTLTAPTKFTASMDMQAKPLGPNNFERSELFAGNNGKTAGTPAQQQWVTSWLAKRYRVAGDATNMLVSAAYMTASEINLDPLLILAVMAIESGFNPFAESALGAQGLMQVMSKVHHEKFQDLGGVKAALNPLTNIKVGSLILKDYVTRGGSVEAGLKLYVGAAGFETDSGYGSRVLAEYRRLKEVATGKPVPVLTPVNPVVQKPRQSEPVNENKVDTAIEAESASAAPKYLPRDKTDQVAAL